MTVNCAFYFNVESISYCLFLTLHLIIFVEFFGDIGLFCYTDLATLTGAHSYFTLSTKDKDEKIVLLLKNLIVLSQTKTMGKTDVYLGSILCKKKKTFIY